jgi:hypothetical protein
MVGPMECEFLISQGVDIYYFARNLLKNKVPVGRYSICTVVSFS